MLINVFSLSLHSNTFFFFLANFLSHNVLFYCLNPPSQRSITPAWSLYEMEEHILAIETEIDRLVRSPHPNLLTPSRK